MRLRLILPWLLVALPAWAAPSPVGLWWTQDRSGVIAIAPCAGGLCGRIVGQPHPRNADGGVPVDAHGVPECGDAHGVPECGLEILHAAQPTTEEGRYRGVITNPEDASNWNCEIWVDADGALRLRGYVLIPLLGETQVWSAFSGAVAEDCSIQ